MIVSHSKVNASDLKQLKNYCNCIKVAVRLQEITSDCKWYQVILKRLKNYINGCLIAILQCYGNFKPMVASFQEIISDCKSFQNDCKWL